MRCCQHGVLVAGVDAVVAWRGRVGAGKEFFVLSKEVEDTLLKRHPINYRDKIV
jgi:hypothetical protein